MHGYSQDKDDYLTRLRRIEGQVRGLQRMVEEDKYCIDILTQVSAVTRALQSVALGLLDEHLGHCVAQAVAEGGETAAGQGPRGLRRDRPPGPLLSTGHEGSERNWHDGYGTYAVTGMTCEHCVRAVTEELTRLGGVTGVTSIWFRAAQSAVTVTSDAPLAAQASRRRWMRQATTGWPGPE